MTQTLKIPSTAVEYPIFSPNWGPDYDRPKELLPDVVSPYSRNMQIVEGKIQGRLGLGKLLDVALNGAIISQPRLMTLGGTRYYLFCTPTDIYSLDYGNSRFDILTPLYTTGTVEVQAGTPTILRGTGTSWLANAKIGDFVKLGAGSVHTDSTWYEVASVDSDTQITLTSAAPTTGAGASYVLRDTFTGDDTNYWDWKIFDDDNLGRIVIMTNGVNTPVYWTGSNQCVNMSGLPTGFTTAKYVDVFKNRVLFLWCVVGGANQRQRIYNSAVADSAVWSDTDFRDLSDEPSDIKGTAIFKGYHIVFKEDVGYVGRFIGGDDIFGYDLASECKGTLSRQSIVSKNDFMEYYGSDKKIHRWNLLQDEVLTEMLYQETQNFDPNRELYVHGYDNKRYNEIRFFCPYGDTDQHNYVIVHNYKYQDIKVWEYEEADAICSMGNFILTSDVYADDAVFGALYADQTPGYADDVTLLANSEIVLYGGYDGYVRIADSGTNDDGTAYTRLLRFKPLNFSVPHRIKRLRSQVFWLEQAQEGTVTIKMRIDNSSSYHGTTKSISLAPEGDEEVVKESVTWDLHAIAFQPEISATNFFSLLGFINYVFPKGYRRG